MKWQLLSNLKNCRNDRRDTLLRYVATGEHEERLGWCRYLGFFRPHVLPQEDQGVKPSLPEPVLVQPREAERTLGHAQANPFDLPADGSADRTR